MPGRSPESISRWLDLNLYKFDGPQQFLGTEPNAARRPWDTAQVRWLLAASWDYSQAAGNMAVPAVYDAVHKAGVYTLADRFYLPATPRDMDLLERGQVPVFGIESRHQARDFDVLATSISYTVLFMNFCKFLSLSGIPLRWKDRKPEDYPMVMAGGQAYCAPEFMAPVVDCVWLGEAEDEEGNPGIGAVCERIAQFKRDGTWSGDREGCYLALAREFNFLYFPRYTGVAYHYEDRGLPELTKMVSGYLPLHGVPGTFKARRVANLAAADLMTSAPLLFSDPGMGSGDVEVGRGCEDWCSFPLHADEPIITRDGVVPIGQVAGDTVEVWTPGGWRKGHVESHGVQPVQRITFVPATPSGWQKTETCQFGHSRDGETASLRRTGRSVAWEASDFRGRCTQCRRIWQRNAYYRRTGQPEKVVYLEPVEHWTRYIRTGWRASSRTNIERQVVATPEHGWELADGTETHDLQPGDTIPAAAVSGDEGSLDYRRGWLHGMVFGDGYKPGARNRRRYHIVLFGEKDQKHLWRFEQARAWTLAEHGLEVRSIRPSMVHGHEEAPSVWLASDIPLKEYPKSRSSDYLAGFVAGWMAADSSRGSNGEEHTRRLYSQRADARAWLDRHAAEAGWVLVGHSASDTPTNYGPRSAPMNAFVLGRPEGRGWKVRSIEPEDTASVFCMEVPEVHRFTLAGGLVTQNCRLSWVTKPYRQEPVERSVARAKKWRDNMGSVDISLVAPDPPVHTQKKRLIAELLEQVTGRVDASSMRIDDYISDPDFSLLLQVSGTVSLTLGLEGNSQRMRDLAGKGTSDDDVAEAVTRAIRAGIRKIKLYFITNWPGEEQADVMRIVELGKRLADIRDSFGEAAAGVQIIFSWTPLLIEAQTPLQWFEVTPPDYMLQAALDELREQRVWIKIGSKASPPKLAFFQACQRASRDVGEAIVDVIENYGSASWGGFPKDMKERIDDALVAHGFRNGLDDIFGERSFEDLLGWEMIDTGVSRSLMWRAYRDMVEFLEGTDAETYDGDISEGYHGNEWVPRCGQQCSGNTCGVCDRKDLELRRAWVQAVDRDLAAEPVRPLDQSTVALRVRLRVARPEEFRFVSGTSLEYIVRRAAYRAHRDGFPALAVESVGFASSGTGYRERSAGVDYAEFGLTRVAGRSEIGEYLTRMAGHLHPHLRWDGNYAVLPAAAKLPARPVSLWELEVAGDPAVLAKRLRWWDGAESVPVLIRADSFYAGATAVKGDARDHVADVWLARDGQRTVLRMFLNGRLGPYQAWAALAGKASWLEAARYTAQRLEFFSGSGQPCEGCGLPVPSSLLDVPWSERYCPRCGDEAEGKIIAALTGAA